MSSGKRSLHSKDFHALLCDTLGPDHADILDRVEVTLRDPKNAFKHLEETSPELPSEVSSKVGRLHAILSLADYDEALFCDILEDLENDYESSIRDRLNELYSVIQGFELDNTASTFTTKPLLVLLSIMYKGRMPLQKDLKHKVRSALLRAYALGIGIASPQLDTYIGQDEDSERVRDTIRGIQRIHYLVNDRKQMAWLLGLRMMSAHDIAIQSKARFVLLMEKGGIPRDEALRIHDHATTIDCRNQESWIRLLGAIHGQFKAVSSISSQTSQNSDSAASIITKGNAPGPAKPNLTDIFHLQSTSCNDCCSVTSLSAYFVDLMNFLKSSIHHHSVDGSGPRTAFDVLISRRPDLNSLELSCANSRNKVPYISIVNEIIQSYIASHDPGSKPGLIQAFNEDDETAFDTGEATTSDVAIPTIFQRDISSQLFPLHVFPLNYGLYATSLYLLRIGISRLETLSIFQSGARLLSRYNESHSENKVSWTIPPVGATDILGRAIVAEVLNLQPLDYAAICGENIYRQKFLAADTAESKPKNTKEIDGKSTDILWTHELWGYRSESSMLSEDELKVEGLSFIQKQFLPRSGLTLEQLLELLDSLFIGRRAVITNKDKTSMFDEQLSHMRLRSLDLSTSLDHADNPPIQGLTKELCRDLQAFVRLKLKLGWSISELDAAISTLTQNQVSQGTVGSIQSVKGISALLLQDISYVVRLKNLTGLEAAELLPLWGEIGSHGKSSLYYRLFLGGSSLITGDGVFKPDEEGRILANPDEVIDNHVGAIMAVLRVNESDLRLLMKHSNLSMSSRLDIDSISLLYRYMTLCTILSITPEDIPTFQKVISRSDFFRDPKTTFTVVETWHGLRAKGWSLPILQQIITHQGPSAPSIVADDKPIVDLCLTKIQALLEIDNKWTARTENKTVTENDVKTIYSLIVDPKTAEAIARTVASTDKSTTEKLIEKKMPTTSVSYVLKAISRGLSPEELDDIKAQLEGIVAEATSKKASEKTGSSLGMGRAAVAPKVQGPSDGGTEVSVRITAGVLHKKVIDEEALAREKALAEKALAEKALAQEMLLRETRTKLVEYALPTVKLQILEDLFLKAFQMKLPDLDASILQTLVRDIIQVKAPGQGEATTTKPLLEVLQSIEFLSEDIPNLRSAYFIPTWTGSYEFEMSLPASGGDVEIAINGINLQVGKKKEDVKDEAEGSEIWRTHPLKMESGHLYYIDSSIPLSCLSWQTENGTVDTFKNTTLIPSQCVKTLQAVFLSIGRVANVVSKLGLKKEEISYISSPGSLVYANLNQPTWPDIQSLEKYRNLRDAGVKSTQALIDLLQWLRTHTHRSRLQDLSFRLASTFVWKEEHVIDLLHAKYPKVPQDIVIRELNSIEELSKLNQAMGVWTRANSSLSRKIPIELLFQISTPAPPGETSDDFNAASTLQMSLKETRHSQTAATLREKQRVALVEYLLQQDYIKEMKITEADQLFEYFLIDVQMGGKLETTRMKQAVSTAQLFVQRCLLGLEAEHGLLSKHIDRTKWQWMSKISVWQAMGKAFMYPENWLDPSLRDDKTDLFVEFESSLMQRDLSWDTFAAGLKRYVYGLADIADLDIQAYLVEHSRSSEGIYHLFGRSRSAPYHFFYRKMVYDRTSKNPMWSPWSKMELDIQTFTTDWNTTTLDQGGSYLIPVLRGSRLFVYMPQIICKAMPADPNKTPGRTRTQTQQGDAATQGKESYVNVKVPEGLHPQTWEIRMGWTELFDGKWCPKKVSEASLAVSWDGNNSKEPLPSIANFVFSTKTSGSSVEVHVGYWLASKSNSYVHVGHFKVQDDRLAAKHTDQLKSSVETLPTKFHKFAWTNPQEHGRYPGHTKKTATGDYQSWKPLLAVTKQANTKNLKWTLSFDGDSKLRGVTGLVVDEHGDDHQGRLTFMYPRSESLSRDIDSEHLGSQSNSCILMHEDSHKLVEALSPHNELKTLYDSISSIPITRFGHELLESYTAGRHELTSPYSIYTWELGLHAVLLAVDRFAATQQFDLALQAARLVFDPSANDDSAVAAWKFPPFREVAGQEENMVDTFKSWPRDSGLEMAVLEKRKNPSTTHSTARGRPQAYMKWIVMRYIEILVAAGDQYFRTGSLEDLPLAIERYVEASYVLGPDPPQIPKLGKPVVKTFSTLKDHVDLELSMPFICDIERRGYSDAQENGGYNQSNLLSFLRTTYFCMPPNPKYQTLRALVKDRLFKTRNNLDFYGRPIIYSIDEPSIDPGALLQALQSGGSAGLAAFLSDTNGPIPYQRFRFLITKAVEICNELRAVGEQLLQAKEKKDSEALVLLKLRQDASRLTLVTNIKRLQKEEAAKVLESLEEQRSNSVSQLTVLLQLMDEPLERIPAPGKAWEDLALPLEVPVTKDLRMNRFEKLEMDSADRATVYNNEASAMDKNISALRAIPGITIQGQPMGVGISTELGTSIVADFIQAESIAKRARAALQSEVGQKAARMAALTRQLEERRMQANAKGREIKSLDKQIEIHRKHMDMADADMKLHQRDIEIMTETQNWYLSKYSSEALYGWMENTILKSYYDFYLFALDLARRAEKAFAFENGPNDAAPPNFVRASGYWDAKQDGLLAAHQLALDLKRMEVAYLEKPTHDYQITKNVSLRQIDPMALIKLREFGTATFSIPETLYDMDFPGHYYRRIKSVSLSIPCIIGPYASLNATLDLISHSYRVLATATSAKEYNPEAGANDQFKTDRIPISSIAISSGLQDSGVYELNFNGENMMPFEGAGAISTWNLELPTAVQQFDHQSISDVILHIKYTSSNGGPLFKKAANDAVAKFIGSGQKTGGATHQSLNVLFDLKTDLPNQWYQFQAELKKAHASTPPNTARLIKLPLGDLSQRMPFWARGKTVHVHYAVLFISKGVDPTKCALSINKLGGGKWEPETLNRSVALKKVVNDVTFGPDWELETNATGLKKASDLEGTSLMLSYTFV